MNKNKKGCGCGCFSTILTIIAICMIVGFFGGIAEDLRSKDISQTSNLQNVDNVELHKVYEQLDSSGKSIYDSLLAGVAQGNMSFEFENTTQEMFDIAFTAFNYDHPEFFWLRNGYQYKTVNNIFSVKLTAYNYWTYTMNPEKYIDELNQKINQIVEGGKAYTDTYSKIKYVHDYLVQNITYDYAAAEEVNGTIRSTATEHALSVYGALVNGKTLCGGYSESFYLLMNALGVECHYIQGYAGEYHAWNYLKIDGEYYYMDVTWDDTNAKDENGNIKCPNGVIYNYFCITSDQLMRTHTPDEGVMAPQTQATSYNYFRREGFYFDVYTFDAVAAAFNAQQGQEIYNVQFGSKAELDKAVKELINEYKLSEIDCFNGQEFISYASDGDMYVLTIYVE